MADRNQARPAGCPPWCRTDHPAPIPHQTHTAHQAVVAEMELTGGAVIEVAASWAGRLDGRPSAPAVVSVSAYTDDKTAAVELTPSGAGTLAEVMSAARSGDVAGAFASALAGDCDWLCGALAEAAVLLGYSHDESPDPSEGCRT